MIWILCLTWVQTWFLNFKNANLYNCTHSIMLRTMCCSQCIVSEECHASLELHGVVSDWRDASREEEGCSAGWTNSSLLYRKPPNHSHWAHGCSWIYLCWRNCHFISSLVYLKQIKTLCYTNFNYISINSVNYYCYLCLVNFIKCSFHYIQNHELLKTIPGTKLMSFSA